MTYTEQEAKARICPHITYCENPYQVVEGQAAQYRSSCCFASECMAWRWADPEPRLRGANARYADLEDEELDLYRDKEPERPADLPANWTWQPITGNGEELSGGFWEEPREIVKAENAGKKAARRGFCGLAGQP